jgi:hypothetical protein
MYIPFPSVAIHTSLSHLTHYIVLINVSPLSPSKLGWEKMTVVQQCNFLHCCFCLDEVDRRTTMQMYFADKESARVLASASGGPREKNKRKEEYLRMMLFAYGATRKSYSRD